MQIKTIPFNLPFLSTLAKYIAKKYETISPDFSSILMVFPSERNKVYFREYLLKETKTQGIIPPCILTIDQLYDYIFEKTICDTSKAEQFGKGVVLAEEIERNVLLKEAVEEIKFKNLGQLSFVKFISIGRKLLGFFDELASWNLALKDIENISDKLHFPSQYVEEELSIFKKIRVKYEEILKDKGLIDTTWAHLSMAKNFKTEYLKDFEYIYIAGCLALTFTDILLIKKILTDLPSTLIIHCEKDNLQDNSLDNIFYHHNKILRMLEADIQNIKTISPQNLKNNGKTAVYIQKCKSALDEVCFIVNAISELSPRYPLHRIGVMLPDESFYLPLKDTLEKFNIPYNLSMGIPFRHTPLYAFLKDAHDFIDSNFSSMRFLILLKNPIVKGIIKDGVSFKLLTYKLDSKIRKENLSRISRKIKFQEVQTPKGSKLSSEQILIDYIFGIMDKLGQDCSFGEYVKSLREIIQELVESNVEFHKKSSPILNDLTDNFIKIENSAIPEEFCPKGKDKLKFIINVLETISFPVSGYFLNGVQVIGILESRNIDFDCVIIPSCNEGIFPQKSEKDLFLPANLRKELNLPFYKERDALYCYYFHQLISGKKEVYLSYRTDEKTQLGLRNRWIEKLIENEEKNFIVKEIDEVALTDFSRIFIENGKDNFYGKKYKKSPGASKNGRTLNFLKSFTFSPSVLKTYKQCPYKFYLSYILKMKEPKIIKEEYDASMWGKIFHNALARLYNEKYPEGYAENMKQQVIKSFLKIGEEEFKKAYPDPKASLYWDWEANKKRMMNLIDKEIAHFKEGFKPIKMEKELSAYSIDINDKQKIKIGGIPDRIDAKPSTFTMAGREEKFYIIDYKISKKPLSKTYRIPARSAALGFAERRAAGGGADFTEFQLPLYGLIFAKGETDKIGGLIYYHLDENLQNFLTLNILEEEGANYIQRFKEDILIPTIEEIFNKNFPFCPTEDFDICQRCVFIDHCGRRA